MVVATGARTAFGQIAAGLAEKHSQTAFEAGLSRFSRFLFAVAAVLTAFIFIINVALSRPLIDALLFSLAIAVGIAPEMMPAIVTVSLSAGSKALAAKKVLVKRLVAIEDLGNIEILFTDKTGTLTEGVITFERALDADGHDSDRPLLLGLVCNEADGHRRGAGRGERAGPGPVVGPRRGPGEAVATAAGGYRGWASFPSTTNGSWPRCWCKDPDGQPLLITKGAPEVVLDRCVNVPDGARPALEALFSEGARVVAVASPPGRGHGGAHRRGRARAGAGRAS